MGTNLEKFNLKAFATVILLFPGFMLCAADSNRNYIRHTVLTDTSGTQGIETVKYYDGLGRHVETVALGAGGGGEDLVSYKVLDGLGRTVRAYNPTPVATGDGGFTALQALETAASTEWNDASPYTTTEYEPAPGGRPVSSTGPGNAWHSAGKDVKTEYLANDPAVAELDCRCFDAGDTRAATSTLVEVKPEGKYAEGSLYVTRTTDEDGHVRLEFTDLFGKTVLWRVKNGSEYLDTYYVYDIALNLAAVLPPKLSASLGPTEKVSSATGKGAKLGYFYISDWEGRCRAKKLPGCDWQLFAYTPGGRLVYSQDGVQRPKGECSFFFTDAFGRECVRGTMKRNLTLAGSDLGVPVTASRSGASSAAALGGYAVQNNPIVSLAGGGSNLKDIHKITYYDDYGFLAGKTYASELAYRSEEGYDARYVCADIPAISANGWMTGALTYVLGTTTALASTYYYDHHGNLVQSHEQNILGGYEHYYYHLTFTGKPLAVKHVHTGGQSGTITEVYAYTYDSQERLLTATLSRNGGTAELLASNTYDKFGRLKSVLQGTAAGSTTYGYNVRSWMTSVKAASFQQQLLYQTQTASSTPCYNGNISAMKWGWSGKLAPTDTYIYKYDGADRLTSATHTSARGVLPGAQRANHSVSYAYDPNSNMTELTRYGINLATGTGSAARNRYGVIDRLTMTYDGNQLLKADDAASELTYAGAMDFKDYADTDEEYVYDANGNMTADLNKEMSVTYNELNLPSRYWFDSGHYINLQYTADGTLVRKIYGSVAAQMAGEQGLQAETMAAAASESRLEERCGNHVFFDKVLERSYNGYGYWAGGAYHYNICDYLGNVRTVVKSDGTLCERNDYYPFGMLHDPTVANADVQPRKYGGKELDRQNGLDLYDSQARWYDPVLARTTTMDQLAEATPDISPYAWCAANPVRNIDPDGRSTWVINVGNGKYSIMGGDIEDKDPNIYVYSEDEHGFYTVRGESIGESLFLTSFYLSDSKTWSTGSIIDTSDLSGLGFLGRIIFNNPTLADYAEKARNGHPYDFKVTNGEDMKNTDTKAYYRGMPLGISLGGIVKYASARDVGNIAAGYIAGANNLSYPVARIFFDSYQSYTDYKKRNDGKFEFVQEGLTTRNAEYFGWKLGYFGIPIPIKQLFLLRSLISVPATARTLANEYLFQE